MAWTSADDEAAKCSPRYQAWLSRHPCAASRRIPYGAPNMGRVRMCDEDDCHDCPQNPERAK